MNIIKCQECGSERQTRWSNTKYCLVCRYLGNAKYLAEHNTTLECWECSTVFAPLKRDDKFCPECAPMSQSHPHGHCNLCSRDDQPLLARGIKVCRGCAYDPDKRQVFIKALGQKKRALIENPYVVDREEMAL